MIAPRFNSAGDESGGIRALFVTSYAAKYLLGIRIPVGWRAILDLRSTSWAVTGQRDARSTKNASQTALSVEVFEDIEHSLVFLGSSLSLYL